MVVNRSFVISCGGHHQSSTVGSRWAATQFQRSALNTGAIHVPADRKVKVMVAEDIQRIARGDPKLRINRVLIDQDAGRTFAVREKVSREVAPNPDQRGAFLRKTGDGRGVEAVERVECRAHHYRGEVRVPTLLISATQLSRRS